MYQYTTQIRVRYAETDQMGVVYYGNYAQYFEVGRVETIRSLGMSYKALEDMGVMLPVVEMNIKYLRPAQYDDVLNIQSTIKELPDKHIIQFHQDIYNEAGKMITSGVVLLYFLDKESRKRVNIPKELHEKLAVFFN
ncbi:MAG: thioesterase family protein [Bacteroidota bacterium]